MYACNCLNVVIEPETDDFLKVTLNLTEAESEDSFFKQEVRQTQKTNKISKRIPELVTTRKVGSWFVVQCINCNVHTFAVHRDREVTHMLVSLKLLTGSAITTLKNSGKYSNVFKLVVEGSGSLDREKNYDYLPAELELTLNRLRHNVNEFVEKESKLTEERIRLFTEKQHLALEELRDRALKEYKIITRRVLNHKLSVAPADIETSTNLNMTSPVNINKSPVRKVPESPVVSTPTYVNNVNHIVNNVGSNDKSFNKKRLSHKPLREKNSFDSEVLFQLEDMDDECSFIESDVADSDSEDLARDDTEQFQRQKNNAANLAKSLPMNIPVFMSQFQNHANEDSDDLLSHPEDPMDIAASIKALAKSVHGDTVFGDLPRPRFSSQI